MEVTNDSNCSWINDLDLRSNVAFLFRLTIMEI